MSLGYVIDCLVSDELDIKYYINLCKNELTRIYYGGDYHTGSPGQRYNSLSAIFIAFCLPLFVVSWYYFGKVIHCTKFRWVGGVRRVVVIGLIFKITFPCNPNSIR